jgi:excinuclease ABC subunit A
LKNSIFIKGARENNLQSIDVELPRDKLIVFTGISGSGKSSLAFDTIYAEGRRRYVESLSSYARQFLGQMDKPDIDYIEGLSPSISIDQKTTSHNPRSTVGTVTEIYDYLRLLYARIGLPHCPKCGELIEQQAVDQIADAIAAMGEGTRCIIMAPVVRGRKGEFQKLLEDIAKKGFVRVRLDGEMIEAGTPVEMKKTKKHSIEIVVDRIVVKPEARQRIYDSVETALENADGLVLVQNADTGEERLFSQSYACADCGISMEELSPRMFSFNSPFGACPECSGIGTMLKIDAACIIPDKKKSLNKGAIHISGWNTAEKGSMAGMYLKALSEHYGFSLDVPVEELPESVINILLYGSGRDKIRVEYSRDYGSGFFDTHFEGVATNLERRFRETQSDAMKEELSGYMKNVECPSCRGKRLKPEVLGVTVGGMNITEVCELPVLESRSFLTSLKLGQKDAMIAERIIKEIDSRLGFLLDVGLGYLTLARNASTLSGGEAQRIRLATQIGTGLVGVLYILDEPSIGLHQRDNAKLIKTLKNLRDIGNTLIVVEHDEETIMSADHVLDIGPLAGERGGRIVAQGTVEEIMKNPESLTGQYLSGEKNVEVPSERRQPNGKWLKVVGAAENNLKGIDVAFPLGVITCVTGVSGSGKSSLVNQILYKVLARDLNRARTSPGKAKSITGLEHLDKVILIDQSPIGRTPRSNPATYTGVFDLIRAVFAGTPDARARGYKNGRFSFNVKVGRCEACTGDGIIKIEMHFLPDVYVPCEVCGGKRYNRETLEVRYKGKNIFDVLDMTIDTAAEFFKNLPSIEKKLRTLVDVGLGYVKLGQASTTLSGGEAQRVKLATELSRKSTGRTMYILDEPTTGLHPDDVRRLILILQRLAEGGNSIIVIEHNLDVIKTSDYIIDLGPEGGDMGGSVVATGTPEQVAQCEDSYTGVYLKKALAGHRF